jgi:formiminotetrahydrofolate cyclodeaminase
MIDNQKNIDAFLRVFSPEDNQTGGGTASAVAGAMAAGLVGMVARLSVGRKKMPDPDEHYESIAREAESLAQTLFDGAHTDSIAFDAVMQGYKMPKTTDEEKAARTQAIQTGMIHATRVPLTNAESCARTLVLAKTLEGRSNTNAASDLDCAIYLATAGLRGTLSNVAINIRSIKDETTRTELQSRMQALEKALEK